MDDYWRCKTRCSHYTNSKLKPQYETKRIKGNKKQEASFAFQGYSYAIALFCLL